jgi:3D (Asp-Asp-Asp) domain-containing protein
LTRADFQKIFLAAFAALSAILLSGCESTSTASRTLPTYETPIAKSDFQNVHTTAYTHTEADHTQYSNHNALGGQLQAAGPAIHRAENVARAIPVSETDDVDMRRVSNSSLQPFALEETRSTVTVKTTKHGSKTKPVRETKHAVAVTKKAPKIGSAAADWGRWPMGTTFRLISTGQIYRIDDYGWALAGRNTIDLYMANSHDMNTWGAREESIQILQWGDPQESLRFLESKQNYKHVHRMVLELQGNQQEAAALR